MNNLNDRDELLLKKLLQEIGEEVVHDPSGLKSVSAGDTRLTIVHLPLNPVDGLRDRLAKSLAR